MTENEIMDIAESLPIDLKTKLIEKLLMSLNPTQKEIDELWAQEAERRIKEIENGTVKPIPGEEVFKRIRERMKR
jgi:putative addiction module component (TIGR02574 family)